jgi:hypothetical protein
MYGRGRAGCSPTNTASAAKDRREKQLVSALEIEKQSNFCALYEVSSSFTLLSRIVSSTW